MATAASEELTDWALLCIAADMPCPHGDQCEYFQAARAFFARNAANFPLAHLAHALRKVIISGPCKEARVPFLVGPTNTGKSTLIESFDALFGYSRVFHLPAVSDPKYGLRNWLRQKRFVLWDEYNPVEFAHMGVMPVTTYKKAFNGQFFEIQVPQSFHDGNKDFRWQRGCVFTNKLEGLWEPTRRVSEEDIRHLKSRVELFHCTAAFEAPARGSGERPPLPQCRFHLAKWVRDGAQAYDAAGALQQPPAQVGGPPGGASEVEDLAVFLAAARAPPAAVAALTQQIGALGAVHVKELSREDWTNLLAWAHLREMERRRVINLVPP